MSPWPQSLPKWVFGWSFFRPSPKFPNGVAGIADVVRTCPIHTLEVAFAHKIGRKLVAIATSLQGSKKRTSDRSSTAIAYGSQFFISYYQLRCSYKQDLIISTLEVKNVTFIHWALQHFVPSTEAPALSVTVTPLRYSGDIHDPVVNANPRVDQKFAPFQITILMQLST